MVEDVPKEVEKHSQGIRVTCKTGRCRETSVSVKAAPESRATRQDVKETPGGGGAVKALR